MPLDVLPSLLMDGVPHLPLDKGVLNVNTGILLLDMAPLLTMAPCLPILKLFWQKRRWADLALFSLGFFLAVVYHIAHIEGLENSTLLGLPGSLWRSLDILCAQTLLSRTLGHAVGAHSSLVSAITNAVFPFILMAWALLSKRGDGWPPLTLGAASRTLVLVMIAGLAAKVAFEGAATLPVYSKGRGKKIGVLFFLGFLFFPLPEIWPSLYWLTHSLWHVCLAAGYGLLYDELLEAQQQQALAAKRQAEAARRSERRAARRAALAGRIPLPLVFSAGAPQVPQRAKAA